MVNSLRRDTLLVSLGWAYLIYSYFVRSLPLAPVSICPLRCFFGIPCPLCGTTLAWEAMLHGQVAAASSYNPMAPIILPAWIALTVILTVRVVIALYSRFRSRSVPATGAAGV